MRDLLRREGLAVLEELAGFRTLVALDFDGTLAPIVASRHRARLDAETLRRLDQVARRWPCAVISGRAREDVASRLGGVRLAAVIGNHGAEAAPPLRGEAAWRRRVRKWVGRLAGALEGVSGIDVEDKGLSLTLHVRGEPARRTARRALRELPGAVVVEGKRTLNVLVHGAPGKGRALARLVRRGRYERVLFVGDDGTDEDVFRNPPRVPFAGVVVGRRRGTAAGYHLRSQRDVVRLLAVLARLRPAA